MASLCATSVVGALDVVGVPEPAPSRVRRDGDLAVRKQRAGAMPLIVVFGFSNHCAVAGITGRNYCYLYAT